MTRLFCGLIALIIPAYTAHAKCPVTGKRTPVVYGIGGSTMGSLLGPMLDKVYGEHDIEFKRWGIASSGLARPDFHDWPKEAPGVMDKNKPDIVIVSLGTNDFQPLWQDGVWIDEDDPDWATTYAARVDALLAAITKDDRHRLVIWSGPYAFLGANAVVRAPIVNRIMKARVEAFVKAGGNAVFHDAFVITSDKKGWPLTKAVLPQVGKKAVAIRSKDGVHLTADAVRHLLAKPIVALTLPCFTKVAQKGAKADDESEAPETADERGAPDDDAPAKTQKGDRGTGTSGKPKKSR